MRYVTTLTLRSADREALDGVVDDLRAMLERKGVEFSGPRPRQTETRDVPLFDDVHGDHLRQWQYTVFTREVEIVGRGDVARSIAERGFPDRVHATVSVDQMGRP